MFCLTLNSLLQCLYVVYVKVREHLSVSSRLRDLRAGAQREEWTSALRPSQATTTIHVCQGL